MSAADPWLGVEVEAEADFASEHIEGYARAAMEQGEDGHFSVPLVSHIEGNLYMGGCLHSVRLGDDFSFAVSLYEGEAYTLGPNTARLVDVFHDSSHAITPNFARRMHDLAKIVNAMRAYGKTLVHCQAGLNRSGLVCALALMQEGRSAEDAIALLRAQRCEVVLCNKTFHDWLSIGAPTAGIVDQ